MEMNVLINFHEDPMQNVACRVLTRENVELEGRLRQASAVGGQVRPGCAQEVSSTTLEVKSVVLL